MLRPTLRTADPKEPSLRGGSAYFAIYNAVREQQGLIHGQLDNALGEHCAIGSYFAIKKHVALDCDLLDEVAAINDSMPHASKAHRRLQVLRWLRWKLGTLGMPGFLAAKPAVKTTPEVRP